MSPPRTTQLQIAGPADFEAHFRVSRETLTRLEVYAAELRRWQKTINLVAPSTLGEIWHRHFADSAQVVGLAPPNSKTWVDLGSGGGFPGLIAAIMLAPAGQPPTCETPTCQTKVTLIESDSRKAAFLRHVSRTVGVPVDIFAERAELAATRASLHGADVVSARALAPLARLLEWVEPFAGPGSTIVLPKGKDLNKELQDIEKAWQSDSREVPSLTDPQGRILVMTNLRRRQSSEGQ